MVLHRHSHFRWLLLLVAGVFLAAGHALSSHVAPGLGSASAQSGLQAASQMGSPSEAGDAAAGTARDPASTLGYAVTAGAAPGYIDDRSCAECHAEHFDSYQEVGMARSFARPQNAVPVEDFNAAAYYHRPSNRYYQMRRLADGGMVMARWQLGEEGQRVSYIEQQVDWVMGSGHTSRVYLYRTPSGELFQLPLAWYSQGKGWAMAPGYDWPVHDGLTRRVRRECMFCHNAYPDVPVGGDAYGAPQIFPAELPEGTGCQRCHGPGAEHVVRVVDGEHDVDSIRAAIVNPGQLDPGLRDQVCHSCHLQPTVELMGVRRFGRAEYSHRPGEDLSDYLVLLDAQAADQERSERFEINHHPYRLEQSLCFQKSADLSCLSCHDPHRKVPVAERAAHYRSVCLGCHAGESPSSEPVAVQPAAIPSDGAESAAESEPLPAPVIERHRRAGLEPAAIGDCVSCHMPRRRTQDVIHVAMTDHKIQRAELGRDLLAPLEERDPVIVGLDYLRPESAPEAPFGELYRMLAVMRAGGGGDLVDRVHALLESAEVDELAPWLDVARARVGLRQWPQARRALERVDRLMPERHAARPVWLGLQAMRAAGERRPDEAIELFRRALEQGEDPFLHYNLGVVLVGQQRLEEAAEHLERAAELRPQWLPPLFRRATVEDARARPGAAKALLARSLAADPGHADSYFYLSRLLVDSGQPDEARAVLRRGLMLARDKHRALRYALGEVEAAASSSPAEAPSSTEKRGPRDSDEPRGNG